MGNHRTVAPGRNRPGRPPALRKLVGWRLVPAAMALSLAGCIPDPLIEEALKPSPTRIEAEVTVAKDVNPDITGKASPVQVRLYELSSAAGFQSAAFFALYDDDRGVLGKDLQARDDILAKPGDRLKITREAKAETKHLALIAAYQDLENATWRAAMPLALTETNAVTIEIGRLAVKIAKKKD